MSVRDEFVADRGLIAESLHDDPVLCPLLHVELDSGGSVYPRVASDEFVVEVAPVQIEQAKAWVYQAMYDGMAPLLDPIPCVIDIAAMPTWGG